jgi:FkbH-like protein
MQDYRNISYHKVLENISSGKLKKAKKLKIYGIYTFNPMKLNSFLEFFLKNKNLNVEFCDGQYDQLEQEIFSGNDNSKIHKSDLIIIGTDLNTKLSYNENQVNSYLKNLRSLIDKVLKINNTKKNLQIIFWNTTFLNTVFFNIKNFTNKIEKKINEHNNFLFKISKKYKNFHVFDVNKISNIVGNINFYDEENYFLSKIPYTDISHREISFELSQLITSINEIPKKCLVLDLDNTIWGGVLGEDGMDGIKLGKNFEGEKFKTFQKYIKTLVNRGVILALASKNNLKDVNECFQKHPDMVLTKKDFSNIKVNWEPKYRNIDLIAKELNIGKDSIVFFDDSKFEREQMRRFNPQINIIETPKEPSKYINALELSGLFNQNFQTKEDKKKLYQYKILEKANKLKSKNNNVESFLKKLKMEIEISSINKSNFDRCVQMINKTNQFNLRTKRYNANELNIFLKSKIQSTMVIKLKDKFGDHGITGLVMVNKKKDSNNIYEIDNFLLSCRILGRKVEHVILSELLQDLKKKKIRYVQGSYIKTDKNSQCKKFYLENNFIKKDKANYIVDLKKIEFKKNNIINITYKN